MYEPDKIQWQDEATGFPCLIVRNHMGALCGYVGVSEDHPAYQKGYDDVNVDVHGCLTFSNFCSHGDEATSICHIPEPGESDKVWWLGFDCAHWRDFCPAYGQKLGLSEGAYKDISYVTTEVKSLARQLKDLDK
jgi:hypothetical protein